MADDRYIRQILLPEIGPEGQSRIGGRHAVIVGCGALGSYQAQLLARAGVGRLTIVDRDFVERSNLQRQILFTDADAEEGVPKAVAAERVLRAVNPEISITGVVEDLNAGTAESLLSGADVICDGTDNFEARYLINDFAVRERTPWVYGGVIGTEGVIMPIMPGETPCLRCVFETPPAVGSLPTCETAGVLGSVVAVVAGLQVTETMKLLTGAREHVTRTLLRYDGWQSTFTAIALGEPRAGCPVCDAGDYAYLEGRRGARSAHLCGRKAIQFLPRDDRVPEFDAIARRLAGTWEVTRNEYLLRATCAGHTVSVFGDGRVIVDGTTDEREARSLVARVVGS